MSQSSWAITPLTSSVLLLCAPGRSKGDITYSKVGRAETSRPGAECTGCFCAALCSTRGHRPEGKTVPLGLLRVAQGQEDELQREGRLFHQLQEGFARCMKVGRVAPVPVKAARWLAETDSSARKYPQGWELLLCRIITSESPFSCQSLSKSYVVYSIFSSYADTPYTYVFNVVVVVGL